MSLLTRLRLRYGSEKRRTRAIEQLNSGQSFALAEVRRALVDPSPLIRATAARKLSSLRPEDGERVALLLPLLEDADGGVRGAVIEAFRLAPQSAAVEPLARLALTTCESLLWRDAACALAKIEDKAAADALH